MIGERSLVRIAIALTEPPSICGFARNYMGFPGTASGVSVQQQYEKFFVPHPCKVDRFSRFRNALNDCVTLWWAALLRQRMWTTQYIVIGTPSVPFAVPVA
jgi:hypothetical protein